ncbi:hypothetical protein R3F64_15735 [Halomonas sp. 5021]|jgi:hemerythrin-like domain-containing protein|uniref:hypothetical protein n=1 Tax=Halomonas sp. 5021 TaxID=3082156 RepID=UPI002FC857F9
MNTRQTHLTLEQVTALIGVSDKLDDLADESESLGVPATDAISRYSDACRHIQQAVEALLSAVEHNHQPITQASKWVELALYADDARDLAHKLKETAKQLESDPRELKVMAEAKGIRMGGDGPEVGTFKVAEREGGNDAS